MFGLGKKKESSKALTTNVVVGSPGHISRKRENEQIKARWIAEFRALELTNKERYE